MNLNTSTWWEEWAGSLLWGALIKSLNVFKEIHVILPGISSIHFLKIKVLLLYILSKKYKQGHLSEFRGSKLWFSQSFSTVSNIKMFLFLHSIHQQVVLLSRVRYGWGLQGSKCQTARHKAHFLFLQLVQVQFPEAHEKRLEPLKV